MRIHALSRWLARCVDRWMFRILLLALLLVMMINAYANFINKEYQEHTAQHLDKIDTALKVVLADSQLEEKLEKLLKVTHRIAERLGIKEDESEK